MPFSRLLRLSRPEWGLGLAGLAACAVQGVRHGGAGIIVAYFLASLYTTLPVRALCDALAGSTLLKLCVDAEKPRGLPSPGLRAQSELTSEATFWARLLFITGIVAFLATFMQR